MSHNVYTFQTNPSTQKHDFATTKKEDKRIVFWRYEGEQINFYFYEPHQFPEREKRKGAKSLIR